MHPIGNTPRKLARFLTPALVIACLITSAAFLSFHLAADAPSSASESAGIHFDPPSKCHNARNQVLFDDWVIDEWTPFIHSPVHTILQSGVFSLLGTGTVQMRLLSVLISLLSLWLIFSLLQKDHGYGIALLALAAFTFSADFWVYGRSGLLEPLVMFGMLATLWALRNGYRTSENESHTSKIIIWFALTALLGILTLLSKVISAYFLASMAIMICISPPKRKIGIPVMFLVFGILLAIYLGPFMQINAAYFNRESGYWAERAASSNYLKLWLTQPIFFTLNNTSALTHLAALALCWVFFDLKDKENRDHNIVPAIMALTFITGSQFLSVVTYRPQRYYVPLLIPIAFLAANSIHRIFNWIAKQHPHPRPTFIKCTTAFLTLTFIATLSPISPIRLIDNKLKAIALSSQERLAFSAILVLAVILLWLAIRTPITKTLSRIPLRLRTWGLFACILLALATYTRKNSYPFRHWKKHTRYGMYHFGTMLGERYRDMHIAGTTPLFAVIDNSHHAYKVTGYNLNWSAMTNGTVTHAIIPTQFGKERFFKNKFSNMMARATAVDGVTIGPHPHVLYAFNLKPLEQNTTTGSEPTLSLHNPDTHTPQTRTLIMPNTENNTALVKSRELDLLPGESVTHKFASAKEKADSFMIPRSAWNEGRMGWTEAKRIREITDPEAWEVDAILLRSSKRGDKQSAFAMRSNANGAPAYVGARLRGELKEGDTAFIEWINEDGTHLSEPISPKTLKPDSYSPFILSTTAIPPITNGSLRVTFEGKGKIFVDALLFADNDNPEAPDDK